MNGISEGFIEIILLNELYTHGMHQSLEEYLWKRYDDMYQCIHISCICYYQSLEEYLWKRYDNMYQGIHISCICYLCYAPRINQLFWLIWSVEIQLNSVCLQIVIMIYLLNFWYCCSSCMRKCSRNRYLWVQYIHFQGQEE